jgi:uncharacterized protein
MELITSFFTALVELSLDMAPYILFGLLFAGILHEIVPETLVTKHLGNENILSVIKSTLFGIPLPVCSCGVVPLATSIKKSGASKGATLSFLISTPITGVDSILATYGMFGWVFTLYRVFTSMIIATAAGILANLFDKEEPVKAAPTFSAVKPMATAPMFTAAPQAIKTEEAAPSCCSSNAGSGDAKAKFSLKTAFTYAFGTLLGDIAKPLFWGLLLGALITVAIPENLSAILIEYNWLSYIIVIIIAIPMYVCATASLPIAAALMLSGVSAGAAFVFLSAGPATNTVTIGVVKKMLGTQSLYIYLGTITLGSIIFGLGLDYIFTVSEVDPRNLVHFHEEAGFISIASTLIMWGYIIYFIMKPLLAKKSDESCGTGTGSCCASK